MRVDIHQIFLEKLLLFLFDDVIIVRLWREGTGHVQRVQMQQSHRSCIDDLSK